MNSDKKRIIALVFLGLFFLSLTVTLVSAQFLLENIKGQLDRILSENFGEKTSDVIVSIIVTLIIFAGLYDMLELLSIFQLQWVKYVIAGGITIIGVIYKVPIYITSVGASYVASLGAIGIILEILIVIILFIGLIIGGTWAGRFAAKRQGQLAIIQTLKTSGNVKAAIAGLKDIEEEFKKKK